MTSFLELGVPARLAAVLTASGKTEPFPIQRDTLPDALAGRDVLGRGRTGSGKTIAFSLPLVARLTGVSRTPGRPTGLVLAPTRELATQIAATLTPLADAAGLRVTTIFGGVSQKPQEQALRAGVDIVVACPGRLDDLMKQGVIRLDRVQVSVLDEADHMADMGFLPVVTRILKATPAGGQRMLFSATLDRGVDGLVRSFLQNEVRHEVDEASVPAAAMTHRVLLVTDDEKPALVRTLASGAGRRILFTRTKHHAKKLAKQLTAQGIPAVDLQGNLSQNARERNLAAFGAPLEDGGVRVLVATDVAARGVHVDGVELVVHVDPPEEHKAYLHRSGRTARAGAEGTVVAVVTPGQKRDVSVMLRQAAITAGFEPVDAASAAVAELVGEIAPRVDPADAPPAAAARAAQQPTAGGQAGGGRGQGGSGRGRRGGRGQGGSATAGGAAQNSAAGRGEARGGQESGRGQGGSGRRGGSGRQGAGAQGASSAGRAQGGQAASGAGRAQGAGRGHGTAAQGAGRAAHEAGAGRTAAPGRQRRNRRASSLGGGSTTVWSSSSH